MYPETSFSLFFTSGVVSEELEENAMRLHQADSASVKAGQVTIHLIDLSLFLVGKTHRRTLDVVRRKSSQTLPGRSQRFRCPVTGPTDNPDTSAWCLRIPIPILRYLR